MQEQIPPRVRSPYATPSFLTIGAALACSSLSSAPRRKVRLKDWNILVTGSITKVERKKRNDKKKAASLAKKRNRK